MDLIALKVSAASAAMIGVILQALIMLQLYGKAKIFPMRPETLDVWHRRQGDALLIVFALVAYACVTKLTVDWGDWRIVVHVVAAILTLTALLAKILMVQVFPRTLRYVTPVGVILFVAALSATGTTVVWYLYMWLGQGIRPSY